MVALVNLVLALLLMAAAIWAFAALCTVFGFAFNVVVAAGKRDWRRLDWRDWSEHASTGLFVWIGLWFTYLPIYYIAVGSLGSKRLALLTANLFGFDTVVHTSQTVALLVIAPLLYGALLGGFAFCSWKLLTATVSKNSEYSGHLVAWAMFGYLGLPFLIGLLGGFERGLLP